MTGSAQELRPHNHAVSFYDHDIDVVAEVARFIADGLAHGERVAVVATAAHRAALDEVLVQYGAATARARVAGRYLPMDAEDTLATFMSDGAPDATKFAERIGSILDAASEDGRGVRVFGEMVTVLWERGNVAGAIQLESLWNSMAATRQFSLLCAYPMDALADASLAEASRVCELHSQVAPPRTYAAGFAATVSFTGGAAQVSPLFLPVASAVPAARRFVVDVLTSWGADALVGDALLITSELATNAVEHATSAFRVRLRRSDTALRVAVDDVGPAQPERRTAQPADFGGRGVAIVERVARRWGCEPSPDGKSVWAELAVS
jgi:anti-sigma regulatory factor (Ser/Thr protein kinase)